MALQLKDRVSSGCTATGTNDIVFGDDTPSFQNWSVVDNGSTVYYCIVDKDDFEVGQGVKSTNGISRDTIFSSTNGGAKINLSGNADVFLTYPADKAVAKNENGNVGIGTDQPVSRLHITGDTNETKTITLEDTASGAKSEIMSTASDGNPNLVFKTADKEQVRVDENGRVGIGGVPMYHLDIMSDASTPSVRLHQKNDGGNTAFRSTINGTTGSNYLYFGDSDANNVGVIRYNHANDYMAFTTNGTEQLRIDSDGKASFTGALEANSIAINTSLGYPNDWAVTAQPTEMVISHSGTTQSKIGTDGTMTATSFVGDGSQLTGVTVPDLSITTAKLANKNVTGAKMADNTVTPTQLNVSGNGANNQMLCSSGNGAMKWVNQPSGGANVTAGGDGSVGAFITDATNVYTANKGSTIAGSNFAQPGTWRSMGTDNVNARWYYLFRIS